MAEATWAWDTVLQMKRYGESTFINIARVEDLDGPSRTRDSIEKTHLRSTDKFKEYLPGLKDGGELNFVLQYDPSETSHDATDGLEAAFDDDDNATWRVLSPITGVVGREGWEFEGHITKMGLKFQKDKVITQDVSIKISGPVTQDDYEFTDDSSV